jgi:hypothetical protein
MRLLQRQGKGFPSVQDSNRLGGEVNEVCADRGILVHLSTANFRSGILPGRAPRQENISRMREAPREMCFGAGDNAGGVG